MACIILTKPNQNHKKFKFYKLNGIYVALFNKTSHMKLKIFFILLLAGWLNQAYSQETKDYIILRYEIIDGDTVPVYTFDDAILSRLKDPEAEKKYLRLVRDIKKVLPYAKIAAFRLQLMEDNLNNMTSEKEKKEYIKLTEKAIKEDYTSLLKNMTMNQGKLLVKLIYRETGKTSYEILEGYTNPFTTAIWNTVARFYGGDLKQTYDPIEDYYIEYIIKSLGLE